MDGVSLSYRRDQGEELTTEAKAVAGNMASFELPYRDGGQAGIYRVEGVSYRKDGRAYRVSLRDLGMDVSYGVDREAASEPDDYLAKEGFSEGQELPAGVEASVVRMDEKGNAISENDIEGALGAAKAEVPQQPTGPFERAARDLVVVLDPGHDSVHTGASYNGCREEVLVLSIALFCREQLQKYDGVSVYMTREALECPNGGRKVDSRVCNSRRVEFAAGKNADVYVSFHLNASTSPSARGVGVYYPNNTYRSDIGTEAGGLADAVSGKLSALGLPLWAGGKLIRNSEDNTRYPDGSLADYLAVIRQSKLAGFPAILIEHAFVSNIKDVTGFLNTDDKLRSLGVADAEAIAEYYGLSLRGDVPKITGAQSRGSKKLRVSWTSSKGAVSYQLYRADSEDGDYVKVADAKGCYHDDARLTGGKSYWYKVCALYQDGTKSEFSEPYKGMPLPKPQIASLLSKTGGKIKVSWKAVDGVSKYVLYRSEKNQVFKKIAEFSPSDDMSYLDAKVKTQKEYYYKLRYRGEDGNGYSTYSDATLGWALGSAKISQVSSNTYTSLKVKWKKQKGATGYRVFRSDRKNGKYKAVATVNDVSSYIDEGLEIGKPYYYKIRALRVSSGKNGYGAFSKPLSGSTIKRTYILYARSKKSGTTEIKWHKREGAYAYKVKRSTAKDGKYTELAEIQDADTVKYTDGTARAGKRYFYAVETIIKKNGIRNSSGNSRPVSAVSIAKVPITDMRAQGKGITLQWERAAGANGYQVVRGTELDGTYAKIADLEGADSTSFTDTGVYAGERYFYKVRAVRNGKYVGYGSYAKGTEKWMLAAPLDVAARRNESGQVRLTWAAAEGAAGYEILRGASADGDFEVIATLSGAKKTAYTDTGDSPDNAYYYKVAAIGKMGSATGRGEESEPVSAGLSQ